MKGLNYNFYWYKVVPINWPMLINSCRYPTNKWLKLGTFHARDERTVQSFPLDEHLYAKYVKVSIVIIRFFLINV